VTINRSTVMTSIILQNNDVVKVRGIRLMTNLLQKTSFSWKV